MEERLQAERKADRRRKQDYLVQHVLEAGCAEAFSEFLKAERPGGQEIDCWSLEELESMVALFRRGLPDPPLQLRLDDWEPAEDERSVFVRRLRVPRKPMRRGAGRVVVARAEPIDSGYFGGRTLLYSLAAPEGECQRVEADFRWLHETLGREWPWAALPPLLPRKKSVATPAALERSRLEKQCFLDEALRHPELQAAAALEVFLRGSREEFASASRELGRALDHTQLVAPGLGKKAFEALGRDALALWPAPGGVLEVKLSGLLKSYLVAAEGQFARYELALDKAERCAADVGADMKRLREAYARLQGALGELQSAAATHNAARPFRSTAVMLEESVYAGLAGFFEHQAARVEESRRLFKLHIAGHLHHARKHVEAMVRALGHRGFFAAEFQKARATLHERQLRALDQTGPDLSAARGAGLTAEQLHGNPALARAFALPDDSARFRRYAEVFGFVNLAVFRELRVFEERLVEGFLERFQAFSRDSIGLLQREHSHWAETAIAFEEMAQALRACPAPDTARRAAEPVPA